MYIICHNLTPEHNQDYNLHNLILRIKIPSPTLLHPQDTLFQKNRASKSSPVEDNRIMTAPRLSGRGEGVRVCKRFKCREILKNWESPKLKELILFCICSTKSDYKFFYFNLKSHEVFNLRSYKIQMVLGLCNNLDSLSCGMGSIIIFSQPE